MSPRPVGRRPSRCCVCPRKPIRFATNEDTRRTEMGRPLPETPPYGVRQDRSSGGLQTSPTSCLPLTRAQSQRAVLSVTKHDQITSAESRLYGRNLM